MKKKRLVTFLLAMLLVFTGYGPNTDQRETHAAGDITVSHDVSNYRLVEWGGSHYTGIEFLGNQALLDRLARIYSPNASYYLGKPESTGDGVAWYTPMTWFGEQLAICANPFVEYGFNYTNRIRLSTDVLDGSNWKAFFDRYNSYRFPGGWQAQIDSYNSNASSYSFLSAVIGSSSVSDATLNDIIRLYKEERPNAPHDQITPANLRDFENIMFWSWYFSLDSYLARLTDGAIVNITLPLNRMTQTEQFYNWLREAIRGGRIGVTNAYIEVYYTPDTPNAQALHSNIQVMHTFGAQLEIIPEEEVSQFMRFQVKKMDLLEGELNVDDLSGAEFEVRLVEAYDPDSTVAVGTVVDYLVTDSSGLASSIDLPLGTYDIVEVKAPAAYDINPIAIRVKGSPDGSNNTYTSSVEQLAYNYDGLKDFYNERIKELNENNKANANGEDFKTYAYLVGEAPETKSQDKAQLSYYNLKKFGRLSITKEAVESYPLDPDNPTRMPEGDIEFHIIDQQGNVVDSMKTNEHGQATSKWITAGTYIISQVNQFEGYRRIEDFTVVIDGNWANYTYALENPEELYWLRLVKKDRETGQTIAQQGVQFELYDESGQAVVLEVNPSGETLSLFTTDNTGTVLLPRPLKPGAYTIREVKGPSGYFLDPNGADIALTIMEDLTIEEVVIEVVNEPQKGIIEVYKTGDLLKSYQVDEAGLTRLYFEEDFLAGTRWHIYAAADILSYDGQTLLYHEGDFIEEITTTSDGPSRSSELPLGPYYLKEVETPSSYFPDSSQHLIEISPGNPASRVLSQTFSAFNNRKSLVFEFDKSFEESEYFTVDMTASFGLYLASPYTESGVTIPQDSLIGVTTVTVDKTNSEPIDGYFTVKGSFEEVPIDGNFYIKEMATSEVYHLDDQNQEVSFSFVDTESPSTVVSTVEPFQNDLIRKEIEIFKLEAGSEIPIQGTEFQLIAVDAIKGDQVVASYLTDENGHILIENLELGDYYLQETKATDGYFSQENPFLVELNPQAEETTTLRIDNEKIPRLHTQATIEGQKVKEAKKEMRIDDVVSYYNLIVGKEYELQGILMDKETDKPLLIDGNEVRSTKSFIPTEADGQVTMEFYFDGSSLAGKDIVVFERLYREGREVASHQDINDEGQTVTITKKPEVPKMPENKKTPSAPKTGDAGFVVPLLLLLVALFLLKLMTRYRETEV